MSEKPILYAAYYSSPSRAVWLTARAIGLDFEQKEMTLLNGDHMTPEFLMKNPQHTVPTLEVNGNCIWDSHAINTYLVGKYTENSSLYPKDLLERAKIDQRLYFDSGILFPIIRFCVFRILKFKAFDITAENKVAAYEAYNFIETFLKDNLYIVGNTITLADFSFITSITQLDKLVAPLDDTKFPRIRQWLNRMEELPYLNELNTIPLEKFAEFFAQAMEGNKLAAHQ